MTEVTILHEAEVELWEAVAYYEDKAKGLGLDFESEAVHGKVHGIVRIGVVYGKGHDVGRRSTLFSIVAYRRTGHTHTATARHVMRRKKAASSRRTPKYQDWFD